MLSVRPSWARSELGALLQREAQVTEDPDLSFDAVLHVTSPLFVSLGAATPGAHYVFVQEAAFHSTRMQVKAWRRPARVFVYHSEAQLSGLLLTLLRARDPVRLDKMRALQSQKREELVRRVVESLVNE